MERQTEFTRRANAITLLKEASSNDEFINQWTWFINNIQVRTPSLPPRPPHSCLLVFTFSFHFRKPSFNRSSHHLSFLAQGPR